MTRMGRRLTGTLVRGIVRGVCLALLLGALAGTAGLLYVIAASVGGGLVGVLAFVCLAVPVLMVAGVAVEYLGDGLCADLDDLPQPCQRCGIDIVVELMDLRDDAPERAVWPVIDGVCASCTTEEELLDAAVRPILKGMDAETREKSERFLGRRLT